MIYKYDKETLDFKRITWRVIFINLGSILLLSLIVSLFTLRSVDKIRFISEETKAIIINEANKENQFSSEKLKAYLLELNIRYPHIVYAQAQLETGGFKSRIFKENNNLFGLKQATRRPTTNKGTENGHAYFENWKESVVDYAFYQAAYLKDIRTEDQYLQYLGANYAEDPNYVNKVKKIINELNINKR